MRIHSIQMRNCDPGYAVCKVLQTRTYKDKTWTQVFWQHVQDLLTTLCLPPLEWLSGFLPEDLPWPMGAAAAAAAAKSLQSCPTLCDHRDSSPSDFPIPWILQARTLEWVAISFSNAWKWKVKVKSLSRSRLLVTPWTAAYQAPPSMDFPGKSTGVGCHRLLRYPWQSSPKPLTQNSLQHSARDVSGQQQGVILFHLLFLLAILATLSPSCLFWACSGLPMVFKKLDWLVIISIIVT